MLYVADPTMDGALDILQADSSLFIQSDQYSQPFSESFDIAFSDPHEIRVYSVAEKIHSFFRPKHPALVRMQPQP